MTDEQKDTLRHVYQQFYTFEYKIEYLQENKRNIDPYMASVIAKNIQSIAENNIIITKSLKKWPIGEYYKLDNILQKVAKQCETILTLI